MDNKDTGLNQFQGRETRTTLNNKVLKEFFAYYDSQAKPMTPEQIESSLLTQLKDEIVRHNQDAGDKWRSPEYLPHDIIGKVMLHIENIVMISHLDGAKDLADYASLAIYLPEQGIYSMSEALFDSKIRKYCPSITQKNIAEVIAFLKANAKLVTLNKDPNLTPVNNGIYNRVTKELEPFRPEFIAVKKISTDYNPDAKNVFITCDDGYVWDCESQLDSFSDDPEIRQVLREVMTAVCYPYKRWDKAIMPYSTIGNNGKGTFCKILRDMLGEDVHTSISLKELSQQFMASDLIDHNVVITDENDVGFFIDDAEKFKAAVTHDTLNINRKYKEALKLRWRGIMVQCLNGYPRFKDNSPSILRRFLIIPFDKCFNGTERKYIKEDFITRQDVREYYLKMALENEFEDLTIPQASIDALEEYKTSSNPTQEFYNSEVCSYKNWEYIPMSFLYEHYKAWYDRYFSGIPLGLGTFRTEIVGFALQDPENHFIEAEVSLKKRLPDNAMLGYEDAIIKYQMEQYMNKSYHGSDLEKLTNFKRPISTRGYLRRNLELVEADAQEASEDE